MTDYIIMLNLQLFGEGGDGAGAAPGDAAAAPAEESTQGQQPQAKGRRQPKTDVLANVAFKQPPQADKAAKATQATQAQEDKPKERSFSERIKAEDKEAFQAEVQRILGNRIPRAKANEEALGKLRPVVELLASRYGIEPGEGGDYDLDKLASAVTDDDSYYEEQAAERGMSVDTYKLVHKLEAENERRKAQEAATLEERQRQAAFARLVEQAEQTKSIYPSFDLNTEMSNPAFARLTALGVDAKTAFEVIHKDEILAGGMQYAAQTAARKVSAAVQANRSRPSEGGLGSTAPADVRIDPSAMTREQRAELKRRAARGEKFYF